MALGHASSIFEYMQAARLVTLAEVDLIRCGGYCAREGDRVRPGRGQPAGQRVTMNVDDVRV
jgi:hypothetical protein